MPQVLHTYYLRTYVNMHIRSYIHKSHVIYFAGNTTSDIESLDDSGVSTVVVVVIASAVTFILTLTVTAIITFIATYICIKRSLDKTNTHNLKQQLPGPQEKVLPVYEQVCLPSHTVTKNDLELQPNPAYATSHKVIMDTNPAYESCK